MIDHELPNFPFDLRQLAWSSHRASSENTPVVSQTKNENKNRNTKANTDDGKLSLYHGISLANSNPFRWSPDKPR